MNFDVSGIGYVPYGSFKQAGLECVDGNTL